MQRNFRYQMTCPAPRQFDPTQAQPLFTYAVDMINSFIKHYAHSVPLGYVTIKGIQSIHLDPPIIKEPTTVIPYSPTCDRTTAALQFANVSLILNASDLMLSTLVKDITTPFQAELTGITARIETDCHSRLTITALSLGQFKLLVPDPASTAGHIISKIPDPVQKLNSFLQKYVVGRTFTLPVRVEGLPLLCAPVPEIIEKAIAPVRV